MVFVVFLITIELFYFSKSQFFEPIEQSPVDEVFQYDDFYEYVISNQLLEWDQAISVCRYEFDGLLATLETEELKLFAVEAMSESNMKLDSLWIGLQKVNDTFRWLNMNITISDNEFLQCGNNSETCDFNCLNTMHCGAIVRINHTEPCIVNLRCDANRGFICKRPTNKDDQSTHHGWIRVGQRLYKIFTKQLTYDEANTACINKDPKARLAVVDSYVDAQKLGRYLLIGRPSLERVWIGARWEDYSSQYEFEHEPIYLSNVTDSSKYPPWRHSRMTKPFGCILLDRHLTNVTYFIESYCSRYHSYMCYKIVEEEKSTDICAVGDYDWRSFYNHKDWFQASRACKESAHSGRLAIIKRKDLKIFTDMMEGSKRYLLHVWLGAYFQNGVWIWTYTNDTLPVREENGYPPWIKNKTYTEEVEKDYLCLNIDRENAQKALFYGTLCSYPQEFVCQYDKGTICEHFTHATTTVLTIVPPTSTTRKSTITSYTTKKLTTPTETTYQTLITNTTPSSITTTLTTTIRSTSLSTTLLTGITTTSSANTTPNSTTGTSTTTKIIPTSTTQTSTTTKTILTSTTKTSPTTRTRPISTTRTSTTTRSIPTSTTKTSTATRTRPTSTTKTFTTTKTRPTSTIKTSTTTRTRPTRTTRTSTTTKTSPTTKIPPTTRTIRTTRKTRPTRFIPTTTKPTRRTQHTRYTDGLLDSTTTPWPGGKRIKNVTVYTSKSYLYSIPSDRTTYD